MLLRWDSFSHYSGGEQASKWPISTAAVSATGGRFGGGSCSQNSVSTTCGWLVPRNVGAQMALISSNWKPSGLGVPVHALAGSGLSPINGTYVTGIYFCKVVGNNDGSFQLFAGGYALVTPGVGSPYWALVQDRGGPVFWLPNTHPVVPGQWYCAETKVTWDGDGNITIEVRMNEDVLVTWTPAVTVDGYTGIPLKVEGIEVFSYELRRGAVHSDFYCMDDVPEYVGDPNIDYLGETRVGCVYARAAGHYQDWTPDTGVQVDRVKEHDVDGDTSYISSDTPTQKSTFFMDSVAGLFDEIRGVQLNNWVRREGEGIRRVAGTLRKGSTDVEDSINLNLNSSYEDHMTRWQRDPVAVAPWDDTAVDATEFGVKLIA